MLYLLSVFCPPLAVVAAGRFRELPASLGLTLLFFVPGVLHAWDLVERQDVERRYEAVVRAWEESAG
jgi:uncharacterized membrane protein YqaE (UPF0057 family)